MLNTLPGYQFLSAPKTAYYLAKTAEGTAGPTTLATWKTGAVTMTDVRRAGLQRDDMPDKASWSQTEGTVLTFWRETSPSGFKPNQGDRVLVDDVLWVVQSVGYLSGDENGPQRFRCVCYKSVKQLS